MDMDTTNMMLTTNGIDLDLNASDFVTPMIQNDITDTMEPSEGLTMEQFRVHLRITDAFMYLFSVFGIIWNLLTVIVLARFCGKLNSHYTLIINQCLADFKVCLFILVTKTTHTLGGTINITPCVYTVLAILVAGVFCLSSLNLIVITLDRLLAVTKPLMYQSIMTKGRIRAMVGSIYGVTLALIVSTFIYMAVLKAKDGEMHYCLYYFILGGDKVLDYSLTTLLFGLCLVMPVVYIIIVMIVLKKRMASTLQDHAQRKNSVIVSFLIVSTFIICILPYTILNIYRAQTAQNPNTISTIDVVDVYLRLLPIVNCICDPLIYAARLTKIKKGYSTLWKKIICGVKVIQPQRKMTNTSSDAVLTDYTNASSTFV